MACEKCRDKFEKQEERIRVLEACVNRFAEDIDRLEKSKKETDDRLKAVEHWLP